MTHRHGTEDRRRELYRDALAVIVREYAGDLQIDDVAARVASSRRQLQRVFAEVGHTSFREVLAKARMHEARRLLARADIPIQDVAAMVGYHEPAQFSKRFRRHFGVAPRTFRKREQAAAAQRAAAGGNGHGEGDLPPVARPAFPRFGAVVPEDVRGIAAAASPSA